MPRTYVDNAYNRSVGRAGMPVGSMVISKGSGSGGHSGSSGFGSSGGSSLFAGGYSSFSPSPATSSGTYVDNAYNRSVGRVGMPKGSMPISNSSGGGGGHSGSRSTSATFSESSASSSKTYVDNAFNRSVGRVGMQKGSMPISKTEERPFSAKHENRSGSSYSSTPTKTYVDNSYNRSAGRVGMPVGSMPISKTEERPFSAKNEIRSGSSYSSTPTKTYVDNSYNRSAGRVGMPVGSMPISKNDTVGRLSSGKHEFGSVSGYDDSSSKTYADNASNRRLGRAGMPVGSMVMSKNSQATQSRPGIASSTLSKVYVDNAYNRRLGRVGLPLGTAKVSAPKIRTYTDNPQNRKLGRVGKPIGSMVFHKKDNTVTMQTYIDSKANRDGRRVGLPRGCMPRTRKVSKETETIRDIVQRHTDENGALRYSDGFMGDYRTLDSGPMPDYQFDDTREMAKLQFMNMVCRQRAEIDWYDQHEAEAMTTDDLPEVDDIIPYSELNFCYKIGEGGFAVVFLAEWRGTAVAVKEMKTGKITRKKLDLFKGELKLFRAFDHQNIVRYIGACEEPEHLCIVMEYMKECLFNVIHVNDVMTGMEDEQRLAIIRQICLGMIYLHGKNVAHCDLKSQNILMTTASNGDVIVKISDFGLSMIRRHAETSSANVTMVSGKGTPRYSAPEVLRGERLKASDMMRTDIWSLALIVFEIVYEEEPYPDFNLMQLQKQVGEKGCAPEVPEGVDVNPDIRYIMDDAWQLLPERRPDITLFSDVFLDANYIFVK